MTRPLCLLLLLCCCAVAANAATLTGGVEFRVRSNLTDLGTMGGTSDKIDYFWSVEASGPTQVYHADRTVGTAAADVLGMVGSLTNSVGSTVTFGTVSGMFIQNLSSTADLTITGLATGTIPPLGCLALAGELSVASRSDRLTVETTATSSYRIWLIGR